MREILVLVRKKYWEPRSAQERKLLKWSGLIVAPVFAYLLLWLPAHRETAKLKEILPEMHLQAERMHLQASEIELLRHRPKPVVLDAIALKPVVEDSAARFSLREAIASLDLQQPNAVRLVLPAVSFEKWLGWIRVLQQEQHVRVESANIVLLQQPGMVKISATLTNGGGQ